MKMSSDQLKKIIKEEIENINNPLIILKKKLELARKTAGMVPEGLPRTPERINKAKGRDEGLLIAINILDKLLLEL